MCVEVTNNLSALLFPGQPDQLLPQAPVFARLIALSTFPLATYYYRLPSNREFAVLLS